jgi:quercetin dioxygenase-like cupin family protein
MTEPVTHTPAGHGPHHLMLGTVAVSRLAGGDQTAGAFALLELTGRPDSGPGPHVDPWRETFYVVDGELTFRVEQDSAVRTIVAGSGDAVSIPSGTGHAFRVTSGGPARYLILGTPAGIETFFADAGEPIAGARLPSDPPGFDRDRLLAAFARHGLTPYEFPVAGRQAAAAIAWRRSSTRSSGASMPHDSRTRSGGTAAAEPSTD